jgi:hypothetical protein
MRILKLKMPRKKDLRKRLDKVEKVEYPPLIELLKKQSDLLYKKVMREKKRLQEERMKLVN